MTASALDPAPRLRSGLTQAGLALAAVGAALAVRVALGSPDPAGSRMAGLVFAGCLAIVAFAMGPARARWSWRSAGWGVAGAAVLCLPAMLRMDLATRGSDFLPWAAATTAVVLAEERLLRGSLFSVLQRTAGPSAAVLVTSVAFALLHVPLYGWHVLVLDLAVGVLLGALRLVTGGWAAPAVAHAIADYVGWFTW